MNIEWPHAGADDLLRLKSITILLRNRPHLISCIFESDRPQLRKSGEEILCSLCGLSHGEVVMVMLALDIWNGSGDLNIHEALRTLDDQSWSDCLAALSVFSHN